MTQQNPVDPAIRAARITRTGTVVAAIAAALITATATGVTAYIVGHKQGVAAAPTVTVHETTTVTESVSASETGNGTGTSVAKKPTGGSSLLLLTANETDGMIVTDPQKVNTRDYDQALTAWLGLCNESKASRVYQLDRKYERLQADVGLTDNSVSGSVVVFKVILDDVTLDKATVRLGPGKVRPIDVDLTNVFRVRLEMELESQSCASTYQAGAAWLEPTLS